MTREEIKRLARQAEVPVGITGGNPSWEKIERFVSLVAAAERDACAKVAADFWTEGYADEITKEIAAEIRARGRDE